MEYHIGIGCSFGLDTGHSSVHKELATRLEAKHFHNLSKAGAGNDYIITKLLRYFAGNPDRLTNTTVSIGWSGMYRHDYIVESKDLDWSWWKWRANDDSKLVKDLVTHTSKPWAIEFDHAVRLVRNVLLTQTWLRANNVPYVMYHAIDNSYQKHLWGVRLKELEKQIDSKHFYQWQKSQQDFCDKNKHWITEDEGVKPDRLRANNTKVKDAHPNEEGNKQWAKKIWNHILENNLFN